MKKKKPIILALCLSLLLGGCSDKNTNSNQNPDSASDSSNSSEAAENKGAADNSEQVEDLQKQIERLANIVAAKNGLNKDDIISGAVSSIDIDGDIHAIYDDSAVIEAYKSGDGSKITDEKDKYILEQLKKSISEIIKDGMSDYEKEKAVYDFIFKYTKATPHKDCAQVCATC